LSLIPSPYSLHSHIRQAADREDLARSHVLEEVAHHEVGGGLDVGGADAHHRLAFLDKLAGVGLDGEADEVEVTIVFGVGFSGGLVDETLADRAVLGAKDDSDWRRG
jgi:hypothetical protein